MMSTKWVDLAKADEDNRPALQVHYLIRLNGRWFYMASDGFCIHAESAEDIPVGAYYMIDEKWLKGRPFHKLMVKQGSDYQRLMVASGRDLYATVSIVIAETRDVDGYLHLTLNWMLSSILVGWKEDNKDLRFMSIPATEVAETLPEPISINPDLLHDALIGFRDTGRVEVWYSPSKKMLMLESENRIAVIMPMAIEPYIPLADRLAETS
jgi:hypothetical protein